MPSITLKLTEPKSARYIYLDTKTNRIHLMLPVVSGTAGIGLDNTCKAVYAVREFFGKRSNASSALASLQYYQATLELDIAYLQDHPELKKQKEERLGQITFYIRLLKKMITHPSSKPLSQPLPQYPLPLQRIMKQNNSNFYSMVLRPRLPHLYLRTVNPIFSLPRDVLINGKRSPVPSSFCNILLDTYQTIEIKSKDKRAQLIAAVLATNAGINYNYSSIQQDLTKEVKNRFSETIDFTQMSKAFIDKAMGFVTNGTALEYIEALLGYCAPKLFENDNQSPFDTIESGTSEVSKQNAYDKLSILTQFFLAEINIYCVSKQKTTSNFGMVLEKEETLSKALATCVKTCRLQEGSEEGALLDFIITHQEAFGLTTPLTEEDQVKIKNQFRLHYLQVKDSPHFDEFMIMDEEKPGPFVVHQGAICINFGIYFQAAIAEDPELGRLVNYFLTRICKESKSLHGHLNHQNSLYNEEEENIQLSVDFAKVRIKVLIRLFQRFSEEELERIYKELPEIQKHMVESLAPAFLTACAEHDSSKTKYLNFLPDRGKQLFLLKRDVFTDLSGRTFHCSAFEYAYWAKDIHTMRFLLNYMDDDTKAEMALRVTEIEQDGLTFTLDGQQMSSSHFDFKPLEDVYEIYLKMKVENAADEAWLNIGKEQRLLPIHVILEYCHPSRSFRPCPAFDEETLPHALGFYDYETNHMEILPHLWSLDGLGVALTLFRSSFDGGRAASLPTIREMVGSILAWLSADRDLYAIRHLNYIRDNDLIGIRAELREALDSTCYSSSFTY